MTFSKTISKFLTFIIILIHFVEGKRQQGEYLIHGGYRSSNSELAKHIVSLRIGDDQGIFGMNHYCAGVIISESVILTAAHCALDPAGFLRDMERLLVVAGTTHRLRRDDFTSVHRVRKILPYPRYDSKLVKGDVALFFLTTPLKEDSVHIQRILLTENKPQPGQECTAYGWGTILPDGPKPDELLYVNVSITNSYDCRANYILTNGVICAAVINGKDTGVGDSGGPFVCDGKLSGLVSYGSPEYFLGFYADVWFYRDWILENEAFLLSESLWCVWLMCFVLMELF